MYLVKSRSPYVNTRDRKVQFTQQNEFDLLWRVHPHLKSGCLCILARAIRCSGISNILKDRVAAAGWQENDVES